MAELWVVDASSLISLARVGRLELLQRDGRALAIPVQVAEKVAAGPAADPACLALEHGFGGSPAAVSLETDALEWGLGAGETAVISFAQQQGGVAVLDDGEARTAARVLGVRVIGTLGVVLRAKLEGCIPSAVEVLRELRSAGMRLDDAVIREALRRTVNEEWTGMWSREAASAPSARPEGAGV